MKQEEDFKEKLVALRNKIQKQYDERLDVVIEEMQAGVGEIVADTLAKDKKKKTKGKVVPPHRDMEDEENLSSTDHLTKLFRDANLDAREKLQRPPFSQINT